MVQKIIGGIVLYNPDIERLQQNLLSVKPQVDLVVVVNNGSTNIDAVKRILSDDIVIIHNERNEGIATALNQILQYALDNDFDWALTLDQDSVIADNLVSTYRETLIGKDDVAMIHCKIADRNANMERVKNMPKEDGYIEQCITSASMLRVKAWQQVGGFDDFMFIDSVDFDLCNALRHAGWKIYRTYKTEVLHELGHAKIIKIFGKEYLSLNHSPFRCYYISRNLIYNARKWGGLSRALLVYARCFWTILRYEHPKRKKLQMTIKGLVDGFTCKITKPQMRQKKN